MSRPHAIGRRVVAVVVVWIAASAVAVAQPAPSGPAPTALTPDTSDIDAPPSPIPPRLVVGTHPIPPFVIENPDGSWSGISIDLVRQVAAQLGTQVEIKKLTIEQLVGANEPEIDVTASVNVTANTDKKWDLTHAFYSTGLAIAVPPERETSTWATLSRMFTSTFALTLIGVLILLVGVGYVMWWLERRAADKPGDKDLAKAMFWAFEPVIGYKSSQHRSRGGRLLGTAWGLFGLVFVTGLTANLSARLTVDRLDVSVQGPDDLGGRVVGTVQKSLALKFCERRGLRFEVYPDAEAALGALDAGAVDAVVYEAPILAYGIKTKHRKLRLLPGTFSNHGYAFGLRKGASWRVPFNQALLTVAASDDFSGVIARYLGQSE